LVGIRGGIEPGQAYITPAYLTGERREILCDILSHFHPAYRDKSPISTLIISLHAIIFLDSPQFDHQYPSIVNFSQTMPSYPPVVDDSAKDLLEDFAAVMLEKYRSRSRFPKDDVLSKEGTVFLRDHNLTRIEPYVVSQPATMILTKQIWSVDGRIPVTRNRFHPKATSLYVKFRFTFPDNEKVEVSKTTVGVDKTIVKDRGSKKQRSRLTRGSQTARTDSLSEVDSCAASATGVTERQTNDPEIDNTYYLSPHNHLSQPTTVQITNTIQLCNFSHTMSYVSNPEEMPIVRKWLTDLRIEMLAKGTTTPIPGSRTDLQKALQQEGTNFLKTRGVDSDEDASQETNADALPSLSGGSGVGSRYRSVMDSRFDGGSYSEETSQASGTSFSLRPGPSDYSSKKSQPCKYDCHPKNSNS
jgi:hypothetical protein